MQAVAYFSILLAFASLASASSQPDQVQSGNNQSPVVEPIQVLPQPPQQQSPVVVGSAPVHQVGQEQQGVSAVVPVEHHHHPHHQAHFQGAGYYAPAGLIQVVGEQQQQAGVVGNNKPGAVRSVEQYGQPESAALPANYKPFGSWGLYIGGNPADGYYTNYYKQLGSSVEKQQAGQGEQSVKPSSALSPMLKQASGLSPFAGGDYYPFAYSMNDLSSAAVPRSYVAPAVESAPQQPSVQYHHQPSPAVVGAQVYGSPVNYEANHYGVSAYSAPETYAATKKLGSAYVQQKEASKAAEQLPVAAAPVQHQPPAKGQYQYQSRVYVYPQQVGPMSAPVAFSPAPQSSSPVYQVGQQQVVAYPVPVGSQIVGSQAGVDGAFAPYGVHAFTRYAVKPTVVGASEQSSYHYGVSSQLPSYKQQVYSTSQANYYQPLGYYGYPVGQLHYSQGSIVPAVHGGELVYHSPASQVEASEKSETSSKSEEKSQVNNKQQQKRA